MRKNSNITLGYILLSFCFVGLAVCTLTKVAELSIMLVLLGIIALAAIDLRGVLALAFPVYALLGALFSVVLIENGAYITEQFKYGSNIGASPWLGLYALGFLTVAHLLLTFFTKNLTEQTRVPASRLRGAVIGGSLIVSIFYASLFGLYGLGLSFATRFEWWKALPSGVAEVQSVTRSFLIPILFTFAAIALGHSPRGSRRFLFVLLLPIVTMVLSGEKFSGFLNIGLMFLIGIAISLYLRNKTAQVNFKSVVSIAIIVMFLLWALAEGYKRMGSIDVIDSIMTRGVLQGHVWFGIQEVFKGLPSISFPDLVAQNSYESPSGLDLLSYKITSGSFVQDMIGRGITFTMGGPPGILSVFGLTAGFLVYSVLGVLYSFVVFSAMSFIARGQLLFAASALSLYVVTGTATQMGYWHSLYGTVALGSGTIVILGLINILINKKTKSVQLRVGDNANLPLNSHGSVR